MIRRLSLALLSAALIAGCGSSDGPEQSPDAGPSVDSELVADAPAITDSPRPDLGPAPDLDPTGQLVIEQIATSVTMGESAIIVGPDGTSVLIDTGTGGHADAIAEAITRHTGQPAVDWVILTHYHFDHASGFSALFGNGGRITLRKGVITRGLFDIDVAQLAENGVDATCRALGAAPLAGLHRPMCEGPSPAICGSTSGAPWPASGCKGLLRGDLERPEDDELGRLSFISLGGGARLYIHHANAHVATTRGAIPASSAGLEIGHGATHHENGRSLGGVVRWGSFSFVFSGDLTGEVEAFVAAASETIRPEPDAEPLLAAGTVDVVELGHHGFASSTGQAWVDWLFPDDGKTRNAVVAANPLYVLPPEAAVIDRLVPRLAGGAIWVTAAGFLGVQQHPAVKIASGAVIVSVDRAGTRYVVTTRGPGGESQPLEYQSTP